MRYHGGMLSPEQTQAALAVLARSTARIQSLGLNVTHPHEIVPVEVSDEAYAAGRGLGFRADWSEEAPALATDNFGPDFAVLLSLDEETVEALAQLSVLAEPYDGSTLLLYAETLPERVLN